LRVAVGLYEASRRLETGKPVVLGEVMFAGLRAPGQLGFFGVVLAFAYGVWLQLAFLMFMLFMGSRGLPPASEFVPTLLFTPHGLGLLVAGTSVGGVLATIIFSVSVIAVPLLLTRQIDRKSTRLNSSHVKISYAVFCLKKKKSTSLLT